MKLYNTLNRKTEELIPIHAGNVGMYTCGPTVYDYAHIGNFRAYLFEDFLKRALESEGYTVNHGMNITDVGHMVGDGDSGEDKLEVGARREQKHPLEIAKMYEDYFFEGLKKLNIQLPSKVLRATETIDSQIEIIMLLEEKGFTYQDEAAIYFDTTKLADYGKLTGQKREEMMVGAREEVVVDEHKKHPQDFVLWFFLTGRYESHILHWPSPWGEGFPGWHIECSAISREILGQPFDIHCGGVDHIGVHHTNEIAQSEAAFGCALSNIWVHNEHLLVDGEKMSKSKGNCYTLEELEKRGFSPLDFRYLAFSSHYQSKMNFTWASLEASANARRKLQAFASEVSTGGKIVPEYRIRFNEALSNNLDTPAALAVVWELVRDSAIPANDRRSTLCNFDTVLGLGLVNQKKEEIPVEIREAAELRKEMRNQKNFDEADNLRQKIELLGWSVEDLPDNSYKLIKR